MTDLRLKDYWNCVYDHDHDHILLAKIWAKEYVSGQTEQEILERIASLLQRVYEESIRVEWDERGVLMLRTVKEICQRVTGEENGS